ncbi:hypothetical protein SAY87_014408 [Trapa incisa]|uniref:Uncharacterized protein n=1 Tax=Trapa incisa TaxID=236973 RepID=A0AAN7H2S3_9MYRT|nr:hypothetical protein SAY87_014408 [Trapa incisa]
MSLTDLLPKLDLFPSLISSIKPSSIFPTEEAILPRRGSMEGFPTMLDIWTWICELPETSGSHRATSVLELAGSTPNGDGPKRSIQLQASSSDEVAITFSLHLHGFDSQRVQPGPIWVSDACTLSSDKPFLPLLLQLLRETIARSPAAHDSTSPRYKPGELRPEPVAWIMDSHSPESLSGFFSLAFLTRLFWLCCFDAPGEVGSFFFHSLLAPNIEALVLNRKPVLNKFLASIGVDAEVRFTRSLGYMLAKWLILREVGGAGLKTLAVPAAHKLNGDGGGSLILSYANEAHGLWILKGHAPLQAMKVSKPSSHLKSFPISAAKDAVLKYVLAHQQLEAVIQMEYSVKFYEGYIQVTARVDNIRLHVVKLGFKKGDDNEEGHLAEERHFPSRARLWVGPEVGATYVGGFSLGQSTNNVGRELETQNVVKGSFGKTKVPKVKTLARTSSRTKIRNWRWDQDAEGNAAVFDGVLCDSNSGKEVAASRPPPAGGGSQFQKSYTGANRPFTKAGGVVFAGSECGRDVVWRLSREMEGSVMKWRIGGQIWLTYWPSNTDVIRTSYHETRVVEFCDEVDLPLIPGKVV